MTDSTFDNNQFYQPSNGQNQDQYEVLPLLRDYFQDYNLTGSQEEAVKQLEAFFASNKQVFLLKGYAGTGKTFLLQGIVRYLSNHEYNVISCAPTGKATIVLHKKVDPTAATIHKTIYQFEVHESKRELLSIQDNIDSQYDDDIDNDTILSNQTIKPTIVFGTVKHINGDKIVMIVDESSMIPDVYNVDQDSEFICGSGKLLNDIFDCMQLTSYCQHKIIFVGDPAQLPPVKMNYSPALNAEYISQHFNSSSMEYELTDVVRQQGAENPVLGNATYIRTKLQQHSFSNFFLKLQDPDFIAISNSSISNILHKVADQYRQSIQQLSFPTVTLIAATNNKVQEYNSTLRKLVFPQLQQTEDAATAFQQPNAILQAEIQEHTFDLQQGELLLVVKNNYLHGLYNGQQIIIKQYNFDSYREFKVTFRRQQKDKNDNKNKYSKRDVTSVTLRFIDVVIIKQNDQDPDNNIEQCCTLLLNRLYTNNSEQLSELNQALIVNFKQRHKKSSSTTSKEETNVANTKEEEAQLRQQDEYLNALQANFGYAITCHKAQGSEWSDVYIDCLATTLGKGEAFFRWFYTALTRAKKQVTLINYHPFNSFSKSFKPNYSYGYSSGKSGLSSGSNPESNRHSIPRQTVEIANSVANSNDAPNLVPEYHWPQLSANNSSLTTNDDRVAANVHTTSPEELRSTTQVPHTTQAQHLSTPTQTTEETNPCAWQDEGWSADGDYSDYWGQPQTTAPEFDDFYDDYYCDADTACLNSATPLSSTAPQAPQVQHRAQVQPETQVQQDYQPLKFLAPNDSTVVSNGNSKDISYQTPQQQLRSQAEEMSAAITPDKTMGGNCVFSQSQQSNDANSFPTPDPSVEPLETYCQRLVNSSSIPLRAQFDGNFQYQKRMVFVSESDKKKFMRVMLSYNGSEVFSAVMLSKSTLPADVTQQVLALLKANILHNSISQIESSVMPQNLATQTNASLSKEQMSTAILDDAPIPDDLNQSFKDSLELFVEELKRHNIVVLSWENMHYRLRIKVRYISVPAGAGADATIDLLYNGKNELTCQFPVGQINKQQADLFNAIQEVIFALGNDPSIR